MPRALCLPAPTAALWLDTPQRCAHRCAVPTTVRCHYCATFTAALCAPLRCAHHFPVPQLRSVTTARSLPFRCAHHCTMPTISHQCPPLHRARHCALSSTCDIFPALRICLSLHYMPIITVDRTFVEHLPGAVVFSKLIFLRINCNFMLEGADSLTYSRFLWAPHHGIKKQ